MNAIDSNVKAISETRWLRWSLTGIAVFLAVIAVELSALLGPSTSVAKAQSPPDSGAQMLQLINAQQETNRLLQQILDHLRTGEIKVSIPGTDKGSRGASAPAARPAHPVPRTQTAPRAQ